MVSGIEGELLNLLGVFLLAAGVGIAVAKLGRFPYTIALLLAGLAASVLGVEFGIELSRDLILLVLLPPLLFEGAATTDLESFRADLKPIVTLAVPGVIASIVALGYIGQYAFGFPLLVGLLFAAIILPTDPVSILALFDELGAPERLTTLVEGESLLNDGVGVVVYSVLLGLVLEAGPVSEFSFTPDIIAAVSIAITVASLGGVVVGLAAGYLVYRVMTQLDEHMTEIVLTAILAYGSFLLAEHFLGVSGVIATVFAGLFIGNLGAEHAMSPRTKISIFNAWDTAAFIVNTFLFVAIGTSTPINHLARHSRLIVIAVVLVVAVRALVVYPLTAAVNRFLSNEVSLAYQHVIVWGGLHASIPIALVLGLPSTLPSGAPFPFHSELRAMVFGVAAFSLVVQGLTMARLLDHLGIVTRTEAQDLYELLVGRARAVDNALEAANELRAAGRLSAETHEWFTAEYEREREDLEATIRELLDEQPALREAELLVGERQVLRREKAAILDAIRSGTVSTDIGERLLDEVDLKLDRVQSGSSTVKGREERYEEFWRERAMAFGLTAAELEGDQA